MADQFIFTFKFDRHDFVKCALYQHNNITFDILQVCAHKPLGYIYF